MSRKHRGKIQGEPVTYQAPSPAGGVQLETFIPWTLIKRGVKRQIITPIDAPQAFLEEAARERQAQAAMQNSPLLRALGLAYHWQRLLDEGRFQSITEIAAAEHMDRGQVSKMAQLTRMAPDLVEYFMAGTSRNHALEPWIRQSIPAAWETQRRKMGMT